ncbi:hypothetical protein AZI87_06615 [Bdellovibrio bacteriovorus]|uniref:Uncharacterized protein n=1 Tax=Bdellovibrio bacteriovorus TaxID=959 RepID=A0A162GT63_BDEBC|nr:hypothetical protein [Bdellovibrio bacteriovorus]KYG68896.1 hypothetical protein AZI87_06615 [Bdellovibrio bacteriovorus]
MKKLLIFILLAASPALAGRIDEIVIMTTESVEETLDLWNTDKTYEITYQDFTTPDQGFDLAVKTKLNVKNVRESQNQEWTCVTQFVKTPRFFDVSKTDCK